MSIATLHASKASKVGNKGMVYSLFCDKFVWNFAIYCKKNNDTEEVAHVVWGKARLAHKVVLDLAVDV